MKHNAVRAAQAVALAISISPASVSLAQQTNYVPFPNVRAPHLPTANAADSGAVNTDVQFIADRQAIINHVTAYSYLIDEGRWDEWYALFSDDFEFVNTTPELGTVTVKGMAAFKALVNERYIIPGRTSRAIRRHTMGNVNVIAQTPTTAIVRTYMLISNVPDSDKLLTLTTGTYNGTLEKRNGKWTITRWYIEADAPLAPSQLPEGFLPGVVTYVPDPFIQIPDAVVGPIKGSVVTPIDRPATDSAAGHLYTPSALMTWKNADFVLVDYLTDTKSVAAFLPEQVTTLPIPDVPGYAAVKLIWAHYRESSFQPYDEFFVSIPCLYKGQLYLYVPLIYVDNDEALAAGRELGGWPKKFGEIKMRQFGKDYQVSFSRQGQPLVSASFTLGSKLFSTPLPADKPVTLGYPYNLTLPLPPPSGSPQESFPLPTATLKVIPGVGSDSPPPVVAQLIGANWRLSGNFNGSSNVSLGFNNQSDDDPFYKLPVLKVLDAVVVRGEMDLALKEITVLDDLLAKK
jgi:acetoacetate decarboxylase